MTRAAALQERPAASCRQESGAAALWSRCATHAVFMNHRWGSFSPPVTSTSVFQAVCCADHEHCCPQSYTCNMQTGTCEKKNQAPLYGVPQSTVVRAEPADRSCDSTGEVRCSERDTCCRISASQWACCPSPKVCPHQRHVDHGDSMMS